MQDQLEVHSYDGKINKSMLSICINLSIEEKKKIGNELLSSPRLATNDIAVNYLQDIIKSIGTNDNVDITNGLNADDLICLCYTHSENPEFIKELCIQLEDMATGFCPQGRTHRLFQLLMAFRD